MKRLGITQRVEVVHNYGERRDCLDQQWSNFILHLGYIPVPLPNIIGDMAAEIIKTLQLDAIILSGGNSIVSLNPNAPDKAPERDEFEKSLISAALEANIPLIGICRGMQLINLVFGGALIKVHGHIGQRHTITSDQKEFDLPKTVNSFHHYGILKNDLAKSLTPLAYDEEGNIEAFYNLKKNILGLMWHPEREKEFTTIDIQLLKRFLF